MSNDPWEKIVKRHRLTDDQVEEIKKEALRQRTPIRKKLYGKRKFPIRSASEYINTGQRPRALIIGDELKYKGKTIHNDQIFRNKERARGLSKPVEEETWQQRQDMLLRTWAAKDGRGHGIEEWHFLKYHCVTGRYKLAFYAEQWMFVEYTEDWSKVIRRGKIFPSRDMAITALKLGIAFND